MKIFNFRVCFCFLMMGACFPAVWAADGLRIHLIPQPVNVSERPGEFVLYQNLPIIIDASGENLNDPATWFANQLKTISGISVQEKKSGKKGIHLKLITDAGKNIIGQEGYRLSVTPSSVTLSANTSAGIFPASS